MKLETPSRFNAVAYVPIYPITVARAALESLIFHQFPVYPK
jgi:hypothetical protein|tara:strand:+ start:247 stop:369 length:123 start_codon:yes stop_codon:yes gene_type:complete